MKVSYTKGATRPKDLVTLLKSRGLIISDEKKAVSYLTNISYFRFSAYLHPLLKNPKTAHQYKIGVIWIACTCFFFMDSGVG